MKNSVIDLLVRPNVRNMSPYSSARDEFSAREAVFLDANENPFGQWNRYPDSKQQELKEAVSKLKKINVENIFLGNGSDEIIDLAFRIFCNPQKDKVLCFYPTYGMYATAAALQDVELVYSPLDDNFQMDMEKVKILIKDEWLKLIFICSPNNPTGNKMREEDIIYILSNFKGIVVLDEAYIDFSSSPSFMSYIQKYPRLIVMQTFSKAWGMAALRVGMAFADQDIIAYLNKVKPPYNISSLNQEKVLERLQDEQKQQKEIQEIKEERERLINHLSLSGVIKRIYPSETNFILVEVEDAHEIYQYLISKNIVVRNRTSVIKNCLRITIGTKEENNELIQNLKNIENEKSIIY